MLCGSPDVAYLQGVRLGAAIVVVLVLVGLVVGYAVQRHDRAPTAPETLSPLAAHEQCLRRVEATRPGRRASTRGLQAKLRRVRPQETRPALQRAYREQLRRLSQPGMQAELEQRLVQLCDDGTIFPVSS